MLRKKDSRRKGFYYLILFNKSPGGDTCNRSSFFQIFLWVLGVTIICLHNTPSFTYKYLWVLFMSYNEGNLFFFFFFIYFHFFLFLSGNHHFYADFGVFYVILWLSHTYFEFIQKFVTSFSGSFHYFTIHNLYFNGVWVLKEFL